MLSEIPSGSERGVSDVADVPEDVRRLAPQPQPQVLADSVYQAIKAMIMDHAITPGARVGIDALSRHLEVSPTPVREALARLESDGLVVKRSLAGYRATELLTAQGLEELFEMRLLLEPTAAALAAGNADERQLDRLEQLVEAMRSQPGADGPYAVYRQFAALDQCFHDLLAEAALAALSSVDDAPRRIPPPPCDHRRQTPLLLPRRSPGQDLGPDRP
jgi:DNA-binding GntR family transcriptional regulator